MSVNTETSADLIGIVLDGLTPATTKTYRSAYKAFASFLGLGSHEAALRALFDMDRDQATAMPEAFLAHEVKRGLSPLTAATRSYALRHAVRKAQAARLIKFNIDVPHGYAPAAPHDPADDLMSIVLEGLATGTTTGHRSAFSAFAVFHCPGSSKEGALRELFALGRDGAIARLKEFLAHERKRGRSPLVVKQRGHALRLAVRKAQAAGLVKFNIDVPLGYAQAAAPQDPADNLLGVVLQGLTQATAKVYRSCYRAFAAFSGPGLSVEAALRDLFAMGRDRALVRLEEFLAHERERGLSREPMATRGFALRGAVRKAQAAGLIKFNIDGRRRRRATEAHVADVGRVIEQRWEDILRLDGPDAPPHVLGVALPAPFAPDEYMIAKAIIDSGTNGLSMGDLEYVHRGARRILRGMRKSYPTLRPYILTPGVRNGGGYRFGFPPT